MEVLEAIQSIAHFGEVRLVGENIRITIKPEQRERLEPALTVLKVHKREAVEILKNAENCTFPPSHPYISGKLGRSEIDVAMDHLNWIGARIIPGPVLAIPGGSQAGATTAAIAALGMDDLPLVMLPTVEMA